MLFFLVLYFSIIACLGVTIADVFVALKKVHTISMGPSGVVVDLTLKQNNYAKRR